MGKSAFSCVFFLWIFCQVHNTVQQSTPSDPFYIASVVEFAPFAIGADKTDINEQLEGIRTVIQDPNAEKSDIVVFPEGALNTDGLTYVPEPKDQTIPCEELDYHYSLSELSCYARSIQAYLVANVHEKVLCSGDYQCPKKGYFVFNTNVVFDRNGMVISKYRKTHLYRNEIYKKFTPREPQIQTFTTDFGVTFGQFICFDILFHWPTQSLVHEGISDFVNPNAWFQELPFLTSLQLFQGWSQANNVSLLSAGLSNPVTGNSGSGIFSRSFGSLAFSITSIPERKIYTAKVPKKNSSYVPKITSKPKSPTQKPNSPFIIKKNVKEILTKRDYNLDLFTTFLLDPIEDNFNKTMCHGDLCCDFSVTQTLKQIKTDIKFINNLYIGYQYRFVIYSGPGTFQRMEKSEIGVCALVACTTRDLSSCGNRSNFPRERIFLKEQLYFTNITIKAEYRKRFHMLVMPMTVNSDLETLPTDSYTFEKDDNIYKMSLRKSKMDILTFGLYGNYFVEKRVKHNIRDGEL
ncbi:BTD.2 family protein [Megaselia abdita]